MNLRTTLVLLVFVAAGGAFLYATRYAPNLLPQVGPAPADTADEGTRATLDNVLTPDKVTGVEVLKGDRRLVLQRGAGGEWTMPGGWPVRQPEVRQLVDVLTDLHSRFAPIAHGFLPTGKMSRLSPWKFSMRAVCLCQPQPMKLLSRLVAPVG